MAKMPRLLMVIVCIYAMTVALQARLHAQTLTSPAIVGGSAASQGEFPWQARLHFGRTQDFGCGGTLLTTEWVVTAAHCLYGETATNVMVVMGGHLIDTPNQYEQTRAAKQLFIHPSYNATTTNNDIALIQLASPVTLNAYVSTIRLANSNDNALYGSGSITVTGWGTTASGGDVSNVLKKATIPIVPNTTCNTLYGAGAITASMFCAGDTTNGGIDACQGDSGGPVIKNDANNRPVLIGVVSWGNGCADKNYPGVYSRVTALSSFVTSKIGSVDVATLVPSQTKTPSLTRSQTMTKTASLTMSPTNTRTPSITKSTTLTRTATRTASPNLTRTTTQSRTPSNTAVPSSTRSPTNTRSLTSTKTTTITRTLTATPDYLMNLSNGSFEDATAGVATGWTAYSSHGFDVFDTSAVVVARTGTTAAWLGGASNETTAITQTVRVDSSGKYLAFYYKTISAEACGMNYDRLTVSAKQDATSIPWTLDVCKGTVKSTWTKQVIDLSALIGQTNVSLVFTMQNDSTKNSHIFIDDVGFVSNPSADVNYWMRAAPSYRELPLMPDLRRTR